MKTKLHLIGFANALLCLSPLAHAATRTWDGDGANDNWTTATNWVGDVAPVPGDDLVFPSGAERLANNNNFPAGTLFNSITFTGSDYYLQGANLVLAAGLSGLHGSGNNEMRVPIQLNANQTFTNIAGGSLYFLSSTIDLNGRDLTFGAVGEIQTGLSAILGTGSVFKTGVGDLALGSPGLTNTYTGVTEVRQGTLLVQDGAALGATNGSTTVFAGATLNPAGTFTSPEPLVLHGTFRIGGFSIGTNTWTGPVALMATNVTIQAQGNARANLNGPISGNGGLTQIGPGTLALNGTNTYTGSTSNTAGILVINGFQPQSPITITAGTLAGTGTVGTVTASGLSAKFLAPGLSAGILNSSNVTLNSSTTFRVELNGTNAGSGYDQLNVTGTVDLGGSVLNLILGFTPAIGHAFTIVNNDGSDAVVETFSGLPQGAVFTNGGAQFSISYTGGDGNDVVIYRGLLPPRLTGITLLTNGAKRIQGLGLSNLTYTIQATTNLTPVIVWSNLGTVLASNGGAFSFTDTNAPLFPMRFYRAHSP